MSCMSQRCATSMSYDGICTGPTLYRPLDLRNFNWVHGHFVHRIGHGSAEHRSVSESAVPVSEVCVQKTWENMSGSSTILQHCRHATKRCICWSSPLLFRLLANMACEFTHRTSKPTVCWASLSLVNSISTFLDWPVGGDESSLKFVINTTAIRQKGARNTSSSFIRISGVGGPATQLKPFKTQQIQKKILRINGCMCFSRSRWPTHSVKFGTPPTHGRNMLNSPELNPTSAQAYEPTLSNSMG